MPERVLMPETMHALGKVRDALAILSWALLAEEDAVEDLVKTKLVNQRHRQRFRAGVVNTLMRQSDDAMKVKHRVMRLADELQEDIERIVT